MVANGFRRSPGCTSRNGSPSEGLPTEAPAGEGNPPDPLTRMIREDPMSGKPATGRLLPLPERAPQPRRRTPTNPEPRRIGSWSTRVPGAERIRPFRFVPPRRSDGFRRSRPPGSPGGHLLGQVGIEGLAPRCTRSSSRVGGTSRDPPSGGDGRSFGNGHWNVPPTNKPPSDSEGGLGDSFRSAGDQYQRSPTVRPASPSSWINVGLERDTPMR